MCVNYFELTVETPKREVCGSMQTVRMSPNTHPGRIKLYVF